MNPVCFIIPPSAFLLDERVFLTLGVLRVAAVLEQIGQPVEVLDLSGVSNYEEVVRKHVASTDATIFGITATTPQLPAAIRIVDRIRETREDTWTILGGPHITLVTAALRRDNKIGISNSRASRAMRQLAERFDVLVAGDGEVAIFEAINRGGTAKLIDADDPNSPMFLTNGSYEQLPYPARHLVDVDSYHYTIDGERALSLIAQLGCPFECGFCGGRESAMLRRIRTRSSESIAREIEELYQKYNVRGFMMYDDELNVNKNIVELMHQIRDLQITLGVEFRLRGFVKAELFTDEQAKAMYEAGFRWLLVGFESGSPRILQNINKKATREDNTRCMQIAHSHGLKVKALMSIGHPGESPSTVDATRDWLLEAKPDDFDVTVITTYPGTPYYDRAVESHEGSGIWVYTAPKSGDRLYAYDVDFTKISDYYKGDPNGGYRSFVYTDFLTSGDIVSLRDFTEGLVRMKLDIPFNQKAESVRYEASMGQLPSSILRRSKSICE